MYTAVLMMAMTTSVDLPDARRGGCCGGGGCYGSCMGGGGRHSRRGGGCCGCYGGGCYGGCYGGGYGGCYGGGYGGCYGGGFGYGGGCTGGVGLGGCYGGNVIYGGGCIGSIHGGVIMPSTGTGTSGEQLKSKPSEKKRDGETMAPAPATIVVDLPADAKLLIDNEATTSTGSSRVFTSPTLNPGKAYHYTLKAEIVRDGKTVQAEKVIAVKAGETTPVTLTLPVAGVAQR